MSATDGGSGRGDESIERVQQQQNDASMMPPPTPGSIRSSGRAIKPTLKLRVSAGGGGGYDSDEAAEDDGRRASSSRPSSSAGHSMQTRVRPASRSAAMPGVTAQSIRARRLRLNINREQRIRGRGDPTYAGAKKTIPYMQGYDRELDSSDDETGEGMAFEEQIILRMPEKSDVTKKLGEWVRRREVGTEGHEVELKFKDSRRAVFKVGDQMFSSKLVDLPAIIESHKTLDNKQMFKIADISQMLLVTHAIEEEADVAKPNPEPIEGLADDFVYDHGITPPMRWARKRRFRKRIHKRTIETVENEVERLLAEDERAEKVEYKMIDAAEADFSDSDGEGEHGRRRRAGRDSSVMDDGTSTLADGDDRSLLDDFEEGSFMADDDDVDRDLQRELEEEMLLQQQEEEEEEEEEDEEDDDGSSAGGRRRRRARSTSRATSEEDDDDDDDDDDDLFDAGDEEEPRTDTEQGEKAPGEGQEDDDDDDDDLDEEEAELRVRVQQVEAECREIEAMLKRKQAEVDATANALIKQRSQIALKRIQTEFESKRSLLQDLKQERRDGKAAAKAEAEAQAQAEEQAATLAAEAASAEAGAASAAKDDKGSALGEASSAAAGSGHNASASAKDNGGGASGDSTHQRRPAKGAQRDASAATPSKGGKGKGNVNVKIPDAEAVRDGEDEEDDDDEEDEDEADDDEDDGLF